MTWDAVASRYHCLPRVVDSLTPSEFLAARDGIAEARLEGFRLAAYPVWMRHGKKGVSFASFLSAYGIAEQGQAKPKSKKMTKEQRQALYDRAKKIRAADLGR